MDSAVIWGNVIPAVVFVIAFGVTWLLYRHFAKHVEDGDSQS